MQSIENLLEYLAPIWRPVAVLMILTTMASAVLSPVWSQTGGGLLPLVVVTDPEEAKSLDWNEVRTTAGVDYPNRWDDLTLLDKCLWLTTEEVEKGLELSAALKSALRDFSCFFNFREQDEMPAVLSLYVEVHADTTFIRKAERSFSEGAASIQFKQVDIGIPELNVFVNHNGAYLYVFPRHGRSMWRIGYMAERRFKRYKLDFEYEEIQDFGLRYLRLLVDKYQDQL